MRSHVGNYIGKLIGSSVRHFKVWKSLFEFEARVRGGTI